ncbi:MAG TPA: DUF429 domain-containing protein [Micromonosporaceae bacterium]|nr:DUF429 domain-containing protein [Micromonosporaceae bacterium]
MNRRARRAATTAVGVDAFLAGWVAVELNDGAYARAWAAGSLAVLLSDVATDTVVGVDIPLGLLDSGWRTADRAAARQLGPRRSSIFAVPPRPVWMAGEYAEANRLCRTLTGGGLSVQAWGLRRRVLEADAYRDDRSHELFEVHPELAFRSLAGAPLEYGKKTWHGQLRRRALLAAAGVEIPDDLGAAGVVPPDDVLDAAVVAWCAHRIATGVAVPVPDPPDQSDHQGRPIAIWC